MPVTVEELTPYAAASLLALRMTRTVWRPITPSMSLTLHVLKHLEDGRLIELPWPERQWPATVPSELAPHEMLSWRFNQMELAETESLDLELKRRLTEKTWTEDQPENRIQLWEDLCHSELICYAERHLEKVQLNPIWAVDLDWVRPALSSLSLSRRKYVVWAAIRRGGVERLKKGVTIGDARRIVHEEYLRRIRMLHNSIPTFGEFTPGTERPYSLLAQVAIDYVLPIQDHYWKTAPRAWVQISR